jgi:GT2 family glycosyltransferase/ubiquinone/menaquinone biosynthesis C-methylase UbiE
MNRELERFDPAEERGRIAYEHLHRYALCQDRVAGKRVLDLACGSGYGTALLAHAAAEVTGVDLNSAAIRQAKKRYKQTNLKYVTADCYDLPFEAGVFDAVVANEMIEHVDDHDGLVEQAKRVLTPGGLFLISTPNKPVYNRHRAPNVFHVSEMDIPAFRKLLKRHFKHVQFIGARMALVSASFELDPIDRRTNLSTAKIYRGEFDKDTRADIVNEDIWLKDPEYLLAVCSDEPIDSLPFASSVFFSRDDDLWLEHEKVMAWASQLHDEDEELRANVERTREEAEAARLKLTQMERENVVLTERLFDLRRSAEAASEALDRQREALAHGSEQHLVTTSRLLARLTGTSIDAEPLSIVEGMFSLNEQLIVQRTRLEMLTTVEERLAVRERELAAMRVQAERAAALELELVASSERASQAQERVAIKERDLAVARLETERESARVTALEHDLSVFSAQISQIRDERDKVAAEHASLHGELNAACEKLANSAEEREALIAARDAEAANLRREIEALQHRVATQGDGLKGLIGPNATLHAGSMSATALNSTGPVRAPVDADEHSRRSKARFVATHRRVRAQLAGASRAVSGRIPPSPVRRPKSWKQRLGMNAAPIETAIFDQNWISRNNPTLRRISLSSFLSEPRFRATDPHPLFAAQAYLDQNFDVEASGMPPLLHYVRHGWREGRNPHPFFANDWYLEQNSDVLAAGRQNPLDHYLQCGWREGRWPNPAFDPRAYLDRYPDVEAAGFEPLTHYVAYGMAENREAQFGAFGFDWQRCVPQSARRLSLMEYLLTTEATAGEALAEIENVAPASLSSHSSDLPAWPPTPLNDYWPPQSLRDFIISGYGKEALDSYWYLCSVMDAFADSADQFPESEAGRLIFAHAQEAAARRRLPEEEVPDASIIIPVYNNLLDTLLCLVTVLEISTDRSFEIIVADDGSTDATARLITALGGAVRYIRQPRNLGFLGNCNAAALQAKGRYLVLLNNDTLVMPGWLDGLLSPFDGQDKVGLVGSKLINWDGTLQEAGGIFWSDGSAWNFGRGQNAQAPEFCYLKDTDYCSGASIAIPTKLWRELGGFDPVFEPAYCEDSDIAFRIRDAGYRTLYNPESEVVHHEGRSHGRDLASGVKAYQVANQRRLFDRWREVLQREHYPNAENVLRARDRSRGRRHILVVDHYVPQWDKDAGSRTMLQFLEALVDDSWSVTFWPANLHRDPIYTPRLQQLGIEVIFGTKYFGRFPEFLKDRADLYDAVLLSRPHISKDFIDDIRRLTKARVLYYGHDVHFMRMRSQLEKGDTRVTEEAILQMRTMELDVCQHSDVVLYPSEDEAALMRDLVPANVRSLAVPAYRFDATELDTARAFVEARLARAPGPCELLFVGGFAHDPNRDGVKWFCTEVAPLLRANGLDFRLRIVGSNVSNDIWNLTGDDVEVLGFVRDERLLELYRDASLVIAPLRYGAGVKGKVVEAMARGVPIVTTSVGAQGLRGAEDFLFIGDSARDFATAVRDAVQKEAWRQKVIAGLEYVEHHYSTAAILDVFRTILPQRPANS